MPLLKIQTGEKIPFDVLAELSAITAETIGKPETYVMVSATTADMMMSGTAGETAFVEIKSIGGLSRDVNENLSARICSLLTEKMSIPANRIYLNFAEVPAAEWGWNGSLFG